MIGFSPKVNLRKGLEKTFEWFSAQDSGTLRVAETDA